MGVSDWCHIEWRQRNLTGLCPEASPGTCPGACGVRVVLRGEARPDWALHCLA